GEVTLVQETENPKQLGFLIYVPVYQGGAVPETIPERRARLQGFAYSPFRASDLFTSIFRYEKMDVGMEVFDGANTNLENLLFRSGEKPSSSLPWRRAFEDTSGLNVGGRTWTTRFFAQPELEGTWIILSLLTGGTLLSVATFYLTRAQAR